MENSDSTEPLPSERLAKRVAGAFIAGLRFVGQQLVITDLNPHEGRLRGSIMPSEYMQIPDYPPSTTTLSRSKK